MATRSKAPAAKPEATPAPSTESSTTETKAPAEAPNITALVALAEGVVAQDETNRDFTELTKAYQDADRRQKAAFTKHINDAMVVALQEKQDRNLALAYVAIGGAVKTKPATERKAREPRPPANPTETLVDRLAGLFLAYETAAATDLPENLDADWADKLQAKLTEVRNSGDIAKLVAYRNNEAGDKGEAPEVSEVAGRAVRLAFQGGKTRTSSGGGGGGRSGAVYDGPRRSVTVHILNAFEGKPSGTFLSVSEIRNHKSAEYGEDAPSAGAVSAALNGKSVPDALVVGKGGEKQTFGATLK